jgi:hypothetical protein
MRTIDFDQFWPSPPEVSALSADDQQAMAHTPNRIADTYQPRRLRTAVTGVILTSDFFRPENFSLRAESIIATVRGAWLSVRPRGTSFLHTFDVNAAAWLSMGFVCGVISWHAVGFWGFVSASVLHNTARPIDSVAAMLPQSQLAPSPQITTGSLPSFHPKPGACMALSIDHDTGATLSQHCNGGDTPLRDAGRRRRGDRLISVQARMNDAGKWAAATMATPDVSEQAAPLLDSDFDLTITAAP